MLDWCLGRNYLTHITRAKEQRGSFPDRLRKNQLARTTSSAVWGGIFIPGKAEAGEEAKEKETTRVKITNLIFFIINAPK